MPMAPRSLAPALGFLSLSLALASSLRMEAAQAPTWHDKTLPVRRESRISWRG